MNTAFSKNLVDLRKARGLSQKSAAEGLGVSQALLSHYEKGIRECGLDFLVRAAEFYNVSSDYLLGRTKEEVFVSSSITDPRLAEIKSSTESTVNILFAILQKINSDSLNNDVSLFMKDSFYLLLLSLLKDDIYDFEIDKHKAAMMEISSMINNHMAIENNISQTVLNKQDLRNIINTEKFAEMMNSFR